MDTEAAMTGRRPAGVAGGCARCGRSGEEARLLALPVDGRKTWMCVICLMNLNPRGGPMSHRGTGTVLGVVLALAAAGGAWCGVVQLVPPPAPGGAIIVAQADAAAPEPAAPPAETVVPAEPPAAVPPPAETAAPAAEAKPAPSGAEPIGASACLACHSAQESFHDNIHAKVWAKTNKVEFEKSCETCHGNGSLHQAAGGDPANPDFASIRIPKLMKPGETNAMCLTCHSNGERVHWDGGAHEARGVSCADCHGVHKAQEHRKLLTKKTEAETCFACHQDVRTDLRKANHHPVLEGKVTCSDCHSPHGAPGKKLLKGGHVNETCYKCHAEKRGPFLFEHRPVMEDCMACHKPHGSTHGKLLQSKQPFMCQSCHSMSRHPGTLYAIDPRNPTGNTFQELNNRATYRSCVNCHSTIHGSNHPGGVYFIR